MFEKRKKRRELEQALKRIHDAYRPELRAATTDDEYFAALMPLEAESAELRAELEVMRTRDTAKLARKFGLDFPPFETSDENWDDIPYSSHEALTDKAHAKIKRDASEARFTYWERWARLLVPILSLIVPLIALSNK